MKRQTLLARLDFLTQKQQALLRAARELVRVEQGNPHNACYVDQARRDLFRAGVELGNGARRYLGGRGE